MRKERRKEREGGEEGKKEERGKKGGRMEEEGRKEETTVYGMMENGETSKMKQSSHCTPPSSAIRCMALA